MTASVRSVAGKITRSGLDTRTSRPPASTVTASEAGICAKLPRMAALEVVQADITQLDVDAITNAANTQLMHGGGVAGAIQRAAGAGARARVAERAPIGLGEAVETTAGEHARALGHPRGDDGARTGPTSAEIIERATRSTLQVAERLGCESLALVAFGTGVGGFPLDEAARIMVGVAASTMAALERIIFAVHGDEAERAFREAVEAA